LKHGECQWNYIGLQGRRFDSASGFGWVAQSGNTARQIGWYGDAEAARDQAFN